MYMYICMVVATTKSCFEQEFYENAVCYGKFINLSAFCVCTSVPSMHTKIVYLLIDCGSTF